MAVYADCGDCSGQIVVGIFEFISVDKLDDAGNVVKRGDGSPVKIKLKLPAHRVRAKESRFDPTSLAPAMCDHGLAEHPLGLTDFGNGTVARSFIRLKHLTESKGSVRCPLCRGEDRPADMTEAADGTPTGELLMDRIARLAAEEQS